MMHQTTARRAPRARVRSTVALGDVVGEYLINGFAGQGATSYVYRARHLSSFEPVAIKILHPHLASDPAKLRRFVREARMMMRLEHPNIVRFRDIFEDGEQLALVMEYVEGQTLTQWCASQGARLDEAALASVFVDILRGLAHAHRHGIVHRDLKPANVLITQADGRYVAKIIDFGVARFLHEAPADEDLNKIVGTAAYMPPEEVVDPERVGPASDLYSLGVMLYEAACGRRPFDDVEGSAQDHETLEALLDAHVNQAPVAPSAVNPAVSPALESVILRALEKTPEQRFGSAPQLIVALEQALAGVMTLPTLPEAEWDALVRAEHLTTEWHRDAEQRARQARRGGARGELWRWMRRSARALFQAITHTGCTGRPDDPHYLSRPSPELIWP